MDIDVTRKLRPQKASEFAPKTLPPAPATEVSQPLTEPAGHAFPLPGVNGSPKSVPPPEEAHTIRFAVASAVTDGTGPETIIELDPVTGWLVVMKGMGRGRSLPLGYGIHPVGRAEDQRVCVRFGDKKISRRSHVEVSYDGKGRAFYISPGRGSTLGYLNGQPVLQPALLKSGDRITLGDTELAFVPFCGGSFDWQQD